MRVQIQKWGNSLALRIPKPLANESHIDQGSTVDLQITEGKLTITPVTEKEYSLDELLAGISKKNLHKEIKTGDPVGKEIW